MWSALSVSRSKYKQRTEAGSVSENLQWRHIYLASVERFWNNWKTTRRPFSNETFCLLVFQLAGCDIFLQSKPADASWVRLLWLSPGSYPVFGHKKKTFFDCWYRCVLIITIFVFDFLLSAVSSHAWPSGSAMGRGGRGPQVTTSLRSLVLRQPLHIYQGGCVSECETYRVLFLTGPP